MRLYTRWYVSVDGGLDAEAESVEVKYNGDPVPISTLAQDLAGFYITPKSATVNVKGFYPASGSRVDYVSFYLANKFVNVQLQNDAGERMIAQGMVSGPSISSSPNDPARIDISITVQSAPIA